MATCSICLFSFYYNGMGHLMSNEAIAIIIAIVIMVPAILFYELIIVRNYADKFLPPTILSLFSNGRPRNLKKENKNDKTT